MLVDARLLVLLVAAISPSAAAPAAAAEAAAPPAEFTANNKIGPGGTNFRDYPHFRIYNPQSATVADNANKMLEAAYQCFVTDLGWRSSGLSFNSQNDNGPWTKVNVYRVDTLPGAAANTPTDAATGMAYLNVVTQYMTEPAVVVHEFGHALTYAARYWVDQIRTGAWWETVANWVADTYLTHPVCDRARNSLGQASGNSLLALGNVISNSFRTIVDGTTNAANHYDAWPFITYLFNNPDNYPGLGTTIFPAVWDKYSRGSNETPLHVLQRLAGSTKMSAIVGKYWARMAYLDINHPKAQAMFMSQRKTLNYANLDSQGSGKYRVKAARQPRYMGASIMPLKATVPGTVGVTVTAAGGMQFTAYVAVRASSGVVRYVEVKSGVATNVQLASGEEATLTVANTPDQLLLFDPFNLSAEAKKGLDFSVTLTGATV